jgi:hypothetical protein
MPQTCAKCHRVNPAEAAYCFFDGSLLPGQGEGNGGPVNAGVRPFPTEFVFPSGRHCRNFDELALGCVHEWSAAVELLQGGYLATFLGGIGRADLAMVARRAAKFPDHQRGLDMLLEKLPSGVIEPPKLRATPAVFNLGQMQIGENRRLELHLGNQGMRLLYGTLAVDKTPWLALGDEPGVPEKSFDCEHEVTVPVLLKGKRLKASPKPLEGKILIESNGGAAEAIVRVEVPVKPFPHGVLAGARTQRQLAEMAFKQSKESSPLFANGDVARWYAENGWDYPVQGPAATGLAALQQYLEACGLTTAPRVEIDTQAIDLQGASGNRLEHRIRVKAIEKKPAFASATSDQSWLVPRPAILTGTLATIPLEIPSVPYPPDGNILSAKVTVVANGRQKFVVPVRLQVTPPENGGFPMAAPAPRVSRLTPTPIPVAETVPLFDEDEDTPPLVVRVPRRDRNAHWLHVTPLALLLFALLVILVVDAVRERSPSRSVTAGEFEAGEPLDNKNYLRVDFSDPSLPFRFGISVPPANPDEPPKQLTFHPQGLSNNACLRVDGQYELLFGLPPGRPGREHRSPRPRVEEPNRAWSATWDYPEQGIRVTQHVRIRRADQTGKYETCLVRYRLENIGKQPRLVGLRFMLDTFIGTNDGVPFTIPGRSGLCDTMLQFATPQEIPDFIQALETDDLQRPGTVAHLTLKVRDPQGKLELPSRVLLGAWPDARLQEKLGDRRPLGPVTKWEVPLASLKLLNDSAVVIYWDEKELLPGPANAREMAFAYGLGRMASTEGQGAGKLGLTVGGDFRPGGEFTVTALVSEPDPGQMAILTLPGGLQLADGDAARLVPTGGRFNPVTWKVRAERRGDYTITVKSGNVSQSQKVRITDKSFLD